MRRDRFSYLPIEVARQRAQSAAARLSADSRVRLVYLFGSTADPARQKVRDIDLAILTEPALSLQALLVLREHLVLAVGGPLDLVSLNAASIPLAFEVADTGICLVSSSPELDGEWRCRAILRYLDFKPFLERQWQALGERLRERASDGSAA